ncbi:MAG: ABC transporter ATP-binding protein [Myxococcales bacterium]|nr:ABC transporter ATP-binding protein [Myxococcales bacterium]
MASISIRGLGKRYARVDGDGARVSGRRRGEPPPAALAALDLEVADGELVVVVGPSGCGKSTLLRLVAGLETPDTGTVVLGGRDLAGVPPQARDVSMVFQGYALYPHLSVRDNIGFPLKMRRVARPERERRVREAAALVGLEALLGRRPGELSGGERQRVAMARAIVRSPQAFLFDEPLSNLDAKLRAELRLEIAALVRRLGVTSLYVTHDQVEAMTMADRVVVLRAGELQQEGPARAVYEAPANVFVAGFLGTPTMNLVPVERVAGEARAPGLALPLPALFADELRTQAFDGALVVGVRPEALGLGPEREGDVRIGARVTAVEPLGAETYLYVEADGTRLSARLPGFVPLAVGRRATLAVAPGTLHWFDAGSGRRLHPGARPEPAQAVEAP